MFHVNKVNKSSTVLIDTTSKFIFLSLLDDIYFRLIRSWEDTKKTTSTTTTPAGSNKPVTTTWEQHWTKLDDGSGRYVH